MRLRLPDLRRLQWLIRPADTSERNIRNVLIDGVGVGIVTGVGAFLPVFLARLGASNLQVGLITSLPALTGALLAVPFGHLLERRRNIVPWYSNARAWVLWSYALFGIVPFLVPQSAVAWTIIAIWALVTVPSTVVNVAFTVVMGGVAGPRRRFYLMSRRWSILGATTAITVALVGAILEMLPFPLNYQVVFIGSFGGGLVSYLFSRAIVLPDNTPSAAPQLKVSVLRRLRTGWAAVRARPAFAAFIGSAFVFRSGIAMALPLFPLYWVRTVQASDAWIGIIQTANSAVLLIAYFLWSNWARRYGIRRVLLISSLGMALYPLLTAVTPVVWLLAVYAAMVGFMLAGNDLVTFDLVLSTCPADHQPVYVGFYQTLQNLALFVMPLVGTLLAEATSITLALLVAGALRLLGTLLYAVLGVGHDATAPTT